MVQSHESGVAAIPGEYIASLAAVAAVGVTVALSGCSSTSESSPATSSVPAASAEQSAQPGGDRRVASPTAAPNPDGTMPYYVDRKQSFYDNVKGMTLNSNKYNVYKSELSKLLDQPAATWLGEWLGDNAAVQRRAEGITTAAETAHQMPVIVSYNIPNRDLGEYSSGGKADAAAFTAWTTAISSGIGDRPAVVILEPDALPNVPDMPQAAGAARVAMLRGALQYYHDHNPKARVYLDAGNSTWLEPEALTALLRQVDGGTGLVRYLSFNTSNYRPHEETVAYFNQVNRLYGGSLKAIVDDGLNGAPTPPPAGVWCNPREARLGRPDGVYDPAAAVEGIAVRIPGESSGECNNGGNPAVTDGGDPPAGEFDPNLLLSALGHPAGRYAR